MQEFVGRHPIRVYDVDAFGELRTTTLLHFLQQTASDASAAVGFDVDWYERHAALWIIRRSAGEILQPARYRDELVVRTWVSDIRRVRSQREYDVTRAADGATLCRARTDWVYVDLARGRLLQPPAAMQRALMPSGITRAPRPAPPVAGVPERTHRSRRRVELADLDSVAHVNNAEYAGFVEQGLWDALAAAGWPLTPSPGAAHARLQRFDLEYLESARYGDWLDVASWTSGRTDRSFSSGCALQRDGSTLLHAALEHTWSSRDLPAELAAAIDRLDPSSPL
jgi:acyl-CoA thioester hydrolase